MSARLSLRQSRLKHESTFYKVNRTAVRLKVEKSFISLFEVRASERIEKQIENR